MFKDKLTNFKMKNDETTLEMFYRLQVIINDLKSLGEKVQDEDFTHRFLNCLPQRFKTLCTSIFRGGLQDVTPNEVLGDVMTDDQYNDKSDEVVKDEDKKKKSVAFKAGTSSSKSKSKGKTKKEESSDNERSNDSDIDDEAMALFVRKFGKFMKKKGFNAKKRREHFKNQDYMRRCYKCKSKDHVVADCPHNSDNDENDKKKKEKNEKKIIFKKKKKVGSYVVTWDSDASSNDDDSSDDEKKTSKKKTFASIAINNKPSLFDSPSCFMAKATKVKQNESDDNESSESESDNDDEEYSKEQLMDMLEQVDSYMAKKNKKCKELVKKLQALEQSFDELNTTHERLVEAHKKLERAHTKLEKAHSCLLNQRRRRLLYHVMRT
jgi:hypothetical protein